MIRKLADSGPGNFHLFHKGQSIDDLIIQYMQDNHVPGLALSITQAPYITRIVGYGLADSERKLLVASNTLFNIGQLSQAFTAVAIMQLKQQGKLKLDEWITAYLSDVPLSWSSITIRHLLTHSSGLPSFNKEPFDSSQDYSFSDLVQSLVDKPLLFPPGSKMNPSASDYYFLGKIVEKASGLSYEEHVTKNQIERLGLKHTFFISNVSSANNELNNGSNPFKHSQFLINANFINPSELAQGYGEKEGKFVPSTTLNWSSSYADSGIVASAEDLSLWDIGLAGGILLSDPEDRKFVYQPISLSDGQMIPANCGWFFPGSKGFMEIKGNTPGFSAFLGRFTASTELLGIALLTNKDDLPDLDLLARKILTAFEPKLGAPNEAAAWSETLQSPYSVTQTLDRVMKIIKGQGGTVFAHISHSEAATKAGQTLLPTEVLIVGNPAKGTQLMQTNPAFALDLPLRIMATEDSLRQVWLSFTDPLLLAKEYGISEEQLPVLRQMSIGFHKICEKAISPVTLG